MTVEKLNELYSSNIKSIMNSQMLSTISDRTYDINGFNLLNRLIIYIQNKYVTSLKSDEHWGAIGRQTRDKASPIWIIETAFETKYIDNETHEIIDDLDLSLGDIDKAIKLGIIGVVKNPVGLRCIPLYNIKDTSICDKETYQSYMKKEQSGIKISTLLKVRSSKLNIKCAKVEN